jgi:protein TonB
MQTALPAAAAVDSEPTTGGTKTAVGGSAGESAKTTTLPLGPCEGRYTDEARRAGVEGTVILDIVVGEDGWVRDVAIVRGLAAGLGEAAVRALKSCRFTPGERGGKPVAVRVRGFKVKFVLR